MHIHTYNMVTEVCDILYAWFDVLCYLIFCVSGYVSVTINKGYVNYNIY